MIELDVSSCIVSKPTEGGSHFFLVKKEVTREKKFITVMVIFFF